MNPEIEKELEQLKKNINILNARLIKQERSNNGVTLGQNLTDLDDLELTEGDILYQSSEGLVNLGAGDNGQLLSLVGGVPNWVNPAGGGGMELVYEAYADDNENVGSFSWNAGDYEAIKILFRGISNQGTEKRLDFLLNGQDLSYVYSYLQADNSGNSDVITNADTSFVPLGPVGTLDQHAADKQPSHYIIDLYNLKSGRSAFGKWTGFYKFGNWRVEGTFSIPSTIDITSFNFIPSTGSIGKSTDGGQGDGYNSNIQVFKLG